MKHTPGPWIVQADPSHFDSMTTVVGGHAKTTGGTWPLFEMTVQVGGFANAKKLEANAKLIESAPEMLVALELIELTTHDAMTKALARVAIEKVLMK